MTFRKSLFLLSLSFTSYCWAQEGIHKTIDEFLLSGECDRAEEIALDARRKHPDNSEALCALACVYRCTARKSVISINTSALGVKEGESGSFVLSDTTNLGRVFQDQAYYERGEYVKAETLYYKIIKIDPHYHNAYFNLMNDYTAMNEFGNYFSIVDLFIANLKNERSTPNYLLDQAHELVQADYLDEALKLYEKMVSAFPNRLEPRSDIGTIRIKQGKFIEAEAIYEDVYEKDKQDRINLNNYIYCSIFNQHFKTARDLYLKLAQVDDKKYNHYYDIGLLSYLIGEEYREHFKKFMSIESTRIPADSLKNNFWYFSANKILEMESKPDVEKIELFEYLLKQCNKAELYKLSLVLASIIEKIEITNFALLVKASIYDRHNFYERTIEYLDKIKARKRVDNSIMSDYNLTLNYGRISYVAGKYDAAIFHWLKNFNQKSNNAFVNHYLGMSYLETGNFDEAKKYFKMNKAMDDKEQMQYINYSIRQLNLLNNQDKDK